MGAGTQQSVGREVWELARRQHWVITRQQLYALGFSAKAIRHRVATRRLHRLWPEVFAVGRPAVSADGRLLGAVLACGEASFISHETAAGLWEVRGCEGPIHVSVIARSDRRLHDIKVHRRLTLGPGDVTVHRGIPVTTPANTLIDLASTLRAAELEAAVNEADRRNLIDPERLRAEIERHPGRRGTRALARVLDRQTFTLTDSVLERRFLRLSRAEGLPEPETQVWLNGYRVDFYYAPLGLIVETDGLRYHRTPAQQARDRVRDHAHATAGLETVRFTHAQVHYEPAYVRTVLRRIAHRRATAAQPPP